MMSLITKGNDYGNLFQFLHVCILVFLNQGSSFLSEAFSGEFSYSWALSLPITLFFKFALDIHAHLGLSVGLALPSLIYWAITRQSLDWYTTTVLQFNIESLQTFFFNFIIGVAHYVVLKLVHKLHDYWKKLETHHHYPHYWPRFFVSSNFEKRFELWCYNQPWMRPFAGQDLILQIVQGLCVFFLNGNVMLLCWWASGNKYGSDIGKGISWVSLGSALHVWMKACLKVLEVKAEEVVGATDQANDFDAGDDEMNEKNNEKACQIIGKEGEEPSNQKKDQFQVVNL